MLPRVLTDAARADTPLRCIEVYRSGCRGGGPVSDKGYTWTRLSGWVLNRTIT